jgi:two-component system chemotaxis response regulator CheB
MALERGAVELIAKPKIGVRGFLEDSRVTIVDAVRAAALARLRPRPALERAPAHSKSSAAVATAPASKVDDGVIAIGASTGGTEAIARILAALPASAPGILVVQHMPAGFTSSFARRLDDEYEGTVREAQNGDAVKRGTVLLAPGDRHLKLVASRGSLSVAVEDGPLVSRHRPSIDVLFSSVKEVVGRRAVGVLLTGMGEDGAKGLSEMRASGARTIAQDEATSVVFGMAKKAIERDAAERVLPLGSISDAILRSAAEWQRKAD